MIVSTSALSREDLAHNLLQVVTRFCLAQPRGRRRTGCLKEVEFLTLAILHQRGTLIVGDIQRMLGVLPAQMSRIIRSLETRDRPLITCRINPADKRKINVTLTAPGVQALTDYQATHLRGIHTLIDRLSEEDREDLARLLDKLGTALGRDVEALHVDGNGDDA
jgi:DNA-binding MarR family transcriptional regulator